MKVIEIGYKDALPWIIDKHYAHRVPSISHAYGLYINNVLEGVVTYGKPASPSLCIGICGKEYSNIVIELNRLVVNDNSPRNSSSYLVGRSLRLLPKPKIVVSYADTGQSHIGYVYQATNFIYTGITIPRTDIDTGEKHSRHYSKSADYSKRKIRHQKHRYVFFSGCRELLPKLKYPQFPYPKGDTKRYDSGPRLPTQSTIF